MGYGTFKPVRVERVEEHKVDPEAFDVTPEAAAAISRARRDGRRVIAVGTTTARVLESLDAVGRGRGAARQRRDQQRSSTRATAFGSWTA